MPHRTDDEHRFGRYLFGVLPADGDLALEDFGEFDECCPVELERVAGLSVLNARVPIDPYGDLAVIRDPERLTALVQAHDRVLRQAAATGRALVPVPFGTVVHGRDELVRRVESHAVELRDALQRLDGCDEWGVHVSAPREAAQRAVRSMARNVHDRLAACAEDAVIEPVETGAREARPSVLSAAFLVNRDRRQQLERTVEALRAAWELAGGTVTVSGPWPAYHFARVDLGGPRSSGARVLLGPLSSPERAWST